MKLKFWGTRGSIPTPMTNADFRTKVKRLLNGAADIDLVDEQAVDTYLDNVQFPDGLIFGGNTPCVEISSGGSHLILDSGSGIRACGKHMMMQGLPADGIIPILQSHTHWDHIMGFPFFAPAYHPGMHIQVYGVHDDLRTRFEQQMDRVHFPITMEDMAAEITFNRISIGTPMAISSFEVTAGSLNHPGDAYAFRITDGSATVVYATDGEYKGTEIGDFASYIEFFRGADVLIFDAMYATIEQSVEKEDYGHSTAVIGVDLALAAGVRKLVLFHHDPERDDRGIAESRDRARSYLAARHPGASLEIISSYDCYELSV